MGRKKRFEKMPKIHLACANDELRPVMNYILITKDHVVASDSHMIIKYNTSALFSEEFIDDMPDRFLIHGQNWAVLSKKYEFLIWDEQGIKLVVGDQNLIIPIELERDDLKFPDYNLIIERHDPNMVLKIGINARFLKTIADIMGVDNTFIQFNNSNGVMKILSSNYEVEAYLMPCMINEDISF